MTTVAIPREIEVIPKERKGLWQKIKNSFSGAVNIVETYMARRIQYFEDMYGKEWWRTRGHI